MNTDMKLQKVPVEKLKPAKYNPRKNLKPGDPAYASVIVERFRAACPNAKISVVRDGKELPYEAVLTT